MNQVQYLLLKSNLELALLKLRNAVASKEQFIAMANMETAREGWTCDWSIGMNQAQDEINQLVGEIEKLKEGAQ